MSVSVSLCVCMCVCVSVCVCVCECVCVEGGRGHCEEDCNTDICFNLGIFCLFVLFISKVSKEPLCACLCVWLGREGGVFLGGGFCHRHLF